MACVLHLKRAILAESNSSNSAKKAKWEFVKAILSNKKFEDLGQDELVPITKYLDTKTCLNMLLLCRNITGQLYNSTGFWKYLCILNEFFERTSLK